LLSIFNRYDFFFNSQVQEEEVEFLYLYLYLFPELAEQAELPVVVPDEQADCYIEA
jgi:hypothetical protein